MIQGLSFLITVDALNESECQISIIKGSMCIFMMAGSVFIFMCKHKVKDDFQLSGFFWVRVKGQG